MSQRTKIKKDNLGLYVHVGGYIARPFYGTIFKEGDVVKTHHFGGSCNAGVTFNDKSFKFTRNGKHEMWCTAGHDLNDKKKYDWYKEYTSDVSCIYEELNEKFAKSLN